MLPEAGIEPEGAVAEAVVPPPDVQSRDRYPCIKPLHAPSLPVRVVHRVVEPLEEVRGKVVGPEEGERVQGEPGPPVVQGRERLPQGGLVSGEAPAAGRIGRQVQGPAQVEGQGKGPAVVGPALVERRAAEGGAHAGEVRGAGRCGQELRYPPVREAVHPDLSRGAREPGGPFHRVIPVLHLVAERRELPARGPPPTHVLGDDQVPPGCVPGGVGIGDRLGTGLVVGLAHEDHRPGALPCGWPIYIRVQDRPVPHLCRHVPLDHRPGYRRFHVRTNGPGAYSASPCPPPCSFLVRWKGGEEEYAFFRLRAVQGRTWFPWIHPP